MFMVMYLLFSVLVGFHADKLGKNGLMYGFSSILFSPISVLIFLLICRNINNLKLIK